MVLCFAGKAFSQGTTVNVAYAVTDGDTILMDFYN